MEKNCINCHWYYNQRCNNREMEESITIVNNSNDEVSYIEDGILTDALRENFNFKELAKLFINKLKDEDFLKKNKNIDKLNFEDLEGEIVELIDDSLSANIQSYFSDNEESEIIIEDPQNFSCKFWR